MTAVTGPSRVLRDKMREHRAQISHVMKAYGATNLRMFGSVARGEAHEGSDIDLLVDLEPGGGNPLLRVSGLGEELSDILGARVDVVTPQLLRGEVSLSARSDAVSI